MIDESGADAGKAAGAVPEPIFFARERRMHERAHDYWLSLLRGRTMPAIAELDPAGLAEYAAYSVLLDLGGPGARPRIAFLGSGLRDEAALATDTADLGAVPRGTLLSELTRRFPDIIAYRAPVGFEAEFVGRGGVTIYRGILLPFSADCRRVDAVYGLINGRLLADVASAPDIAAAVSSALAAAPAPPALSVWGTPADPIGGVPRTPAQRIAAARTWAALAAADRTRRQAGLHAALGAAHDLLLDGTAGDIDGAVTLVFGDMSGLRARRRYMLVLAHAARLGLGAGMLAPLLGRHAGGLAGLAAAERRAQRGVARAVTCGGAGHVALAPIDANFFLMLGRCAPAAAGTGGTPAEPIRRAG